MTRPPLTKRQNETYEFIRAYSRDRGKPPTVREIGQALGLRSPNGVHRLLGALEQKGYLRREAHIARGLTLIEDDDTPFPSGGDVPSLLLVGRVRSDRPEALRRRPQGTLFVDPRLIEQADEDACLIGRAADDGMTGAGILKGDFLVVEEADLTALAAGTVVAALIGDLLVARTLQRSGARLTLRPENRTYSTDTVAPGDTRIHVVGRVLAVMRAL